MIKENNLEQLSTNISRKILKAKVILSILEELIGEDLKIGTLLKIILNELNSIFENSERMRKLISKIR